MGWWESYFFEALFESIRVPASRNRNRARLTTWSEGTPELKLNLSLLAEAFLQLIASGLGTLALVWATVVLLGGYSTMLVRKDFWFITAIVFVETARIVGYNSAPEAKFFVDAAAAFSEKNMRVGRTINLVRLLTMGPTWLALAPIFAATACMLLSIIRLLGMAKHGYGSSSIDASNGNLKPALVLFYALVLTQGALFLLWFAVAMNRSGLAAALGWKYLGRFWGTSKRIKFMNRYVGSIEDTCIQKGVSGTISTTLVSFAGELLLQSQHTDDHASAVLVLHSLVIVHEERSRTAVEQICSSEKLVYKLIQMLRLEDVAADVKEYIAPIVSVLACKLRLADIPGAAHCISSLLDPHHMKKPAQKYWKRDSIYGLGKEVETKPLFFHGLVILRELAADPENCTEMYNTMDLVPKIVAPISNGLHMAIKNDETTDELVRESLCVVSRLTSGTASETSRKLCHELTTKYGKTAENIIWILSNSSDQEARSLAVVVLSRLTLDEPIMSNFTAELRCLLLDPDSPLRIQAGKALIACGDEFPDIQQLVTIMGADEYSKEYRVVTAEMLAQICARSKAGQDRNRLSAVANALSTVLTQIVSETEGITDYLLGYKDITEFYVSNREFLASFLGLAVQIREKLVTAEAYADAVTGLPMGNNIFAGTLKRIIEMTTRCPRSELDEVWLSIMKSTTKLVTWVTEIDPINSPWEDIVERLEEAMEDMVNLERYVVMTGGADEKKGYEPLDRLMSTAWNKVVS